MTLTVAPVSVRKLTFESFRCRKVLCVEGVHSLSRAQIYSSFDELDSFAGELKI